MGYTKPISPTVVEEGENEEGETVTMQTDNNQQPQSKTICNMYKHKPRHTVIIKNQSREAITIATKWLSANN